MQPLMLAEKLDACDVLCPLFITLLTSVVAATCIVPSCLCALSAEHLYIIEIHLNVLA